MGLLTSEVTTKSNTRFSSDWKESCVIIVWHLFIRLRCGTKYGPKATSVGEGNSECCQTQTCGQDLEDPLNESIEVRVGLTEEEMTHPSMRDQETGGKKRQLASGSDATRVVKRSRLDAPRSVGALDGVSERGQCPDVTLGRTFLDILVSGLDWPGLDLQDRPMGVRIIRKLVHIRWSNDRVSQGSSESEKTVHKNNETVVRLRELLYYSQGSSESETTVHENNETVVRRRLTNRISMSRSRKSGVDLNLEGRRYVPTHDYSQDPRVNIGKMNVVCGFCRALKFKYEAPGMCCVNGKVRLSELRSPVEPLASLMAGETAESKSFLKSIRRYNSCFQMTSFGATEIVRENYMPCFKIQGQVYHRVGSLLPVADEDPKFLQIYFMGGRNEEVNQRMRFNTNVDRNIVSRLQEFLHEHNELVRPFKTVLPQMKNDDFKIIIKADRTPSGEHEKRYNAPTVDEVSIVIVGEEFSGRDIVLSRRGGGLKRIAETHRSYDGLQYPLLFWEGEDGYHFEIKMIDPRTGQETNKKVSSMNFYGYRLMVREKINNHILMCRELFNQYVVDM